MLIFEGRNRLRFSSRIKSTCGQDPKGLWPASLKISEGNRNEIETSAVLLNTFVFPYHCLDSSDSLHSCNKPVDVCLSVFGFQGTDDIHSGCPDWSSSVIRSCYRNALASVITSHHLWKSLPVHISDFFQKSSLCRSGTLRVLPACCFSHRIRL